MKIKKYTKKKRILIKTFFVGRKEFQRQRTKSTQTEATNNGDRDSTVNKGTKSQLTSEYL